MNDRLTAVVVEDDFLIAEDLSAMCEEFGVEVLDILHDADGAAERILELRPNFTLMDVRLGGRRDGVDVAQEVHDTAPDIKLIFVTGSNEPPTIARIEEDRPHRILIKPISPQDLRRALQE